MPTSDPILAARAIVRSCLMTEFHRQKRNKTSDPVALLAAFEAHRNAFQAPKRRRQPRP